MQYRIAWYKKVAVQQITSNEIPETGDINYGAWQNSKDLVQAWVDALNKELPDIHHYMQVKQ